MRREDSFWLQGATSRRTAIALLSAILAANGVFLLRYLLPLGSPIGSDFTYFWLGARLAWNGDPVGVYDVAGFTAAMREALPYMPEGQYGFAYPPTYLLLLVPLGALPLGKAFQVWLAVSGAAFAAALFALCPRRAVLLLALLAPGFALNLWFGQNGLLFGACVAAALAMAGRRPSLAGVALGLLTLKPHLGAALALVFLFTRQWRVLAVAALTAAAAIALSAAAFGAAIWPHYRTALASAADLSSPIAQGVSVRGSVYWTLLTLGASQAVAAIGQVAAAVLGLAAAVWAWRRPLAIELRLAVVIVALLMILPRFGNYDLACLDIAAVALLGTAHGRRGFLGLALAFWMLPQVVQMASVYNVQIAAPAAALLLLGCLGLASASEAAAAAGASPAARSAPLPPGD